MALSSEAMLERRAPAKVNLYLRVTGRRSDGYHLLDSLAVFVDLADRLRLTAAPRLQLHLEGPFASALGGGDNLVERAARLLLDTALAGDATCAMPGAAIVIEKNIPVAAGLGGGSADAAAALDALNALWGLGLSHEQLVRLALPLGADVPMCLFGRPALVAGIGEVLAPAPRLPDFALLLVNPNRAVATVDVFARRGAGFSVSQPLTQPPADAADLAAQLRRRGNDLTEPAVALCPQIAEVLRQLGRVDGCLLAQMSGSGATCFGLFGDLAAALAAEGELKQRRPHWFVRACLPLG